MGERLGIRAFAASDALRARMGRAVAPSTVTRWGQDGKIVLVDGQVDVAASLERLEQLGVGKMRPDVSARHATETAHKGAQTSSPIPNHHPWKKNATEALGNATAGATETDDMSFAEHVAEVNQSKTRYKAIGLHYENQGIKLGMALSRGMRYYRADVRDEAHGLANALRAAVERLIDQAAPRLAVVSGHADRGLLLKREAAKVRRLIDLEYPNSLRRLRRAAKRGKE